MSRKTLYKLGYYPEIAATVSEYENNKYTIVCDCGHEFKITFRSLDDKIKNKRDKCNSCARIKEKEYNLKDNPVNQLLDMWKP